MRNNDVIFFNLHRRYLNQAPQFGGFIGTFILAAVMNQNGYAAQGFAGTVMEGKRLIDEACQSHKVSIIGLYCDYENVTENIQICRYIKEKYHLPVMVGGPQATALGRDFLDKSGCDVISRYEGELTVPELLDYFLDGIGSLDTIKGIMYKKGNEVILNPEQNLIENLDALPFIDDDCYLTGRRSDNQLSIMTGRGCPFHCAFCHEGHHTKKVRFRSIDNVMEEIEFFLSHRPHLHCYILFTDDTFTLVPDRVKELCQRLKKLRETYRFDWFCEGHIHTLYTHPEMISYIAEAGAKRIQLGIEAGTQEVLDAYRKGSTLDEIRDVVVRCRDAGIDQIYSNIILGGAFYTPEVYERNLQFAKELIRLGKGCVEIGVVSYWPLAETEITNHPEKYDLKIVDKDFITSVGDFPQTETDSLNRWDIVTMMRHMEEEIKTLMVDMLRHDEVPTARILSWIKGAEDDVVRGMWFLQLSSQPSLFAYYQMLASGECVQSQQLTIPFLKAHPMRAVNLYRYIQKKSSEYVFWDYHLSEFEMQVLIYSTGKLSVQEIMRYVHADTEKEKIDVIDALKKMERDKLIVFCEI